MDDYLLARYARQLVLGDIGLDGQERLQAASAAVVGVGGLGSASAMLLARIGIGTLYLIDRDVVSLSDLHRQFLYMEEDVGSPKAEAAKKRIEQFNSRVTVHPIGASLYNEVAKAAISEATVIVDGLDDILWRYYLNRLVVQFKKPYVFASAIETYGNVSTIIPGNTPCLEEFYGGLYDVDLPQCAEVGIHPSILSIISGIAVAEAAHIVMGTPPALAGKLLVADLRVPSTEVLDLQRNGSCAVCGTARGHNPPVALKFDRVELGCSRDGLGTFFIRGGRNDHGGGGEVVDLSIVEERLRKRGYGVLRSDPSHISFSPGPGETITLLRGGDAVALVSGSTADLESIKRRLEGLYDAIAG